MSVQWYSKILNRYKRSAIKSDIKTIAHIASNAVSEMLNSNFVMLTIGVDLLAESLNILITKLMIKIIIL